ncbi:MAG: prephenate dehydrogenase [Phycisphaerae bacterium]|nr:prephenate dehydrogenase [Phycisphaerae bacterium]
MKKLRQVTVIGLGLLGSSVTLAIKGGNSGIKAVAYSHRASTRQKARKLGVADVVYDDIRQSVAEADMVILATPICTFEEILKTIGPGLKKGCIVTDVGSTKVLVHKWAKTLPRGVYFVGSHPIAGSEQRGVDFGRDDLFHNALCIVTGEKNINSKARAIIKKFWTTLGCKVSTMTAREHDKILGNVSHLPHAMAAALLNASDMKKLKWCGKGFIDTTRIASGASNIWTDIFYTNSENICKEIEAAVNQLNKLKKAIRQKDKKQIEKLLSLAREKRAKLIQYKVSKKELM